MSMTASIAAGEPRLDEFCGERRNSTGGGDRSGSNTGFCKEAPLMLVLSRRAHQEVVFPHLNIKLSILQIRGRIVKIGIEAPKNIKVLRQEAAERDASASQGLQAAAIALTDDSAGAEEHRRRNELNLLQLRLEAVQRRIDRGETVDAESTLQSLFGNVIAFDHELAAQQHREAPILENGRAMRLLVVEDCENERRLMAYVLASHGFDVHVARDGQEALEQLRMWGVKPDVVLMDLQMPMSDGLEALHQIRHDHRLADLKVFAVTGSNRVPENEPVGRSWDGWFSKPINVARLIARLREEEASFQLKSPL